MRSERPDGIQQGMRPTAGLRTTLILALTSATFGCQVPLSFHAHTIVCETDNIYREKEREWNRQPVDSVGAFLEKPHGAYRTIGLIMAYQDATWDEETLWFGARVRAAELGADAVLLVGRRIAACKSPAFSSAYLSENGYNATGQHFAVGPREFECAQLVVEAILRKNYSCKDEGTCRYSREDAYDLGKTVAPIVLNMNDPRVQACSASVSPTSSATLGAAQVQ